MGTSDIILHRQGGSVIPEEFQCFFLGLEGTAVDDVA